MAASGPAAGLVTRAYHRADHAAMTDLPADPRSWSDESVVGDRVHTVRSRPSEDAAGDPPLPVKVVAGAAASGATAAGFVPASSAAGAEEVLHGELPPVSVAYESLASFAHRPSARALLGPLLGVAMVGVGLGFLLARTADKAAAPTSRTVVTPPPPSTRAPATTAGVLGSTIRNTAGPPAATSATPTATGAATSVMPTTVTPTAVTPTTVATGPPVTTTPVTVPTSSTAGIVSGVDVVTPVRWAEFRAGKVYLHGRVPNPELAATIVRKVGAVVGADNVVQDYVVDPAAPAVAGGPLTVADTVQFDPDAAVVRPAFGRILELGVLLMQQNAAVTITVVGRADNRGPLEYNRRLSQQRAAAVVAYLVGRGSDPARLTIDARGADDPLAPGDTPDALQANRSVEFVIRGLID